MLFNWSIKNPLVPVLQGGHEKIGWCWQHVLVLGLFSGDKVVKLETRPPPCKTWCSLRLSLVLWWIPLKSYDDLLVSDSLLSLIPYAELWDTSVPHYPRWKGNGGHSNDEWSNLCAVPEPKAFSEQSDNRSHMFQETHMCVLHMCHVCLCRVIGPPFSSLETTSGLQKSLYAWCKFSYIRDSILLANLTCLFFCLRTFITGDRDIRASSNRVWL